MAVKRVSTPQHLFSTDLTTYADDILGLCALCLIFALQGAESSPFVIFDEVDANLDAQYRTAVAELLQSLSKEAGTQFICTTFRPEIVHVADKCYGVTFRNKSSAIGCYDTEDALEFVEGQAPR